MTDHDPLCPWRKPHVGIPAAHCEQCALIARVRADERERLTIRHFVERLHADDALADLRAKVEALRSQRSKVDAPGWMGYDKAMLDVLALIDGDCG